MKKIFILRGGRAVYEAYTVVSSVADFNARFDDWVFHYFAEDGEPNRQCQDWDDVYEVLNTVGASALNARFELEDVPEGDEGIAIAETQGYATEEAIYE